MMDVERLTDVGFTIGDRGTVIDGIRFGPHVVLWKMQHDNGAVGLIREKHMIAQILPAWLVEMDVDEMWELGLELLG